MNPLLRVDDVTVRFRQGGRFAGRQITALNGVTFSLHPQEILAIVGESGSGKSTLGRTIAGLIKPVKGTVTLTQDDGQNTSNASRKRQIQMVLQNPFDSLNPVHNVFYHLSRPLKLHHRLKGQQVRTECRALLEQVDLCPPDTYLERHPHALSGGQRQRVMIARALAVQPRVLIADEPTSMLDVSVREDVLKLLERARNTQDLGVILITHDLAAAALIADNILVLKNGECVEQGSTKTVLQNPKHPYTQTLLAAIPRGEPGRFP